jgi:hypothetical protein
MARWLPVYIVLCLAYLCACPQADPATPVQVHLALSEDPTQMIVMWMANTTGTPTVQYGTQPGSFPSSATGTAKRYTCVRAREPTLARRFISLACLCWLVAQCAAVRESSDRHGRAEGPVSAHPLLLPVSLRSPSIQPSLRPLTAAAVTARAGASL